jgi:hypothetical protein
MTRTRRCILHNLHDPLPRQGSTPCGRERSVLGSGGETQPEMMQEAGENGAESFNFPCYVSSADPALFAL